MARWGVYILVALTVMGSPVAYAGPKPHAECLEDLRRLYPLVDPLTLQPFFQFPLTEEQRAKLAHAVARFRLAQQQAGSALPAPKKQENLEAYMARVEGEFKTKLLRQVSLLYQANEKADVLAQAHREVQALMSFSPEEARALSGVTQFPPRLTFSGQRPVEELQRLSDTELSEYLRSAERQISREYALQRNEVDRLIEKYVNVLLNPLNVLAAIKDLKHVREEIYRQAPHSKDGRGYPWGFSNKAQYDRFRREFIEEFVVKIFEKEVEKSTGNALKVDSVYLGGSAVSGKSYLEKDSGLLLSTPFHRDSDFDVYLVVSHKEFQRLKDLGFLQARTDLPALSPSLTSGDNNRRLANILNKARQTWMLTHFPEQASRRISIAVITKDFMEQRLRQYGRDYYDLRAK